MKATLVALVAVLLLSAGPYAHGQDAYKAITRALATANADQMLAHMAQHVSIGLPQAQARQAERNDAAQLLRDFFDGLTVAGFDVSHHDQREASGYLFGTLRTNQGPYHVSCFLRREDDNYVIQKIRIDKQEYD